MVKPAKFHDMYRYILLSHLVIIYQNLSSSIKYIKYIKYIPICSVVFHPLMNPYLGAVELARNGGDHILAASSLLAQIFFGIYLT